jgi:hypothetical protein
VGNFAAIAVAVLSLGTPNTAALDSLLSRAKTLLAAFQEAAPGKQRNALRTNVLTLLEDLKEAGGAKATTAVARFLAHKELETSAANTLADFGTRAAMRILGRHLKDTDDSELRWCRRRNLLALCHNATASLPNETLEFLLRTERHRDGMKEGLDYLAKRLSLKRARLALASLEGAKLAPAVTELERSQLYDLFGTTLAGGLEALDEAAKEDREGKASQSKEQTTDKAERKARKSAARKRDRVLDFFADVAGDTERVISTRIISLRVLAAGKYEKARGVVRRLVENDAVNDPQFIVNIAQAAARLEEKSAAAFVFKHLKSMVRKLKTSAALEAEVLPLLETLVPLDVREAASLVQKLAKSKHLFLRAAAITALPVAREDEALRGIRSALKQKNWQLRWAAIEACRGMRTKAAVDLLIKHMTKEEGRLQYDLLFALHRLTGVHIAYVPADWKKWWKYSRDTYEPPKKDRDETEGQGNSRTLVIRPSDPNRSYFGLEVISRRLCLVLDISGSMSAELTYEGNSTQRIGILKAQLLKLVKSFDKKTFFNVYVFESGYKKVFDHLVPMTKANHLQLNKFVDKLQPLGATNLFDALEKALQDPHVDTIYLLSDGQPSTGKYTEPAEIISQIENINRLRRVQINTISIGQPSELLEKLATITSGRYREVK